jgi:serine/threonine protein kinase
MTRPVPGKGTRPIDLERLGRYRLVRPLSKGGMALVFEGRRESLAGVAPRVAVKLILPEHADSDTFRELFINEARLGASMHHQNLVQIQDFDQDGEHFYLVMEYVEGLTLRQIVSLCVRHDVPIPIGVVAEIGRQACDGLHYAHQATDEHGVHLGLVHRDVKPSNLMLNPHGVAKILDFGISKGNLLDEKAGAVRGTWGYMAPEQALGREVGPNADVFGLATILYEMASRKPLFRKKKPDEIKRLLEDDHAARMAATLPAEYGPLVGVLVRALQRDPVARYPTAEAFGRALSALLPDPITARDEVVSFFRSVEAIDQGRPTPTPASGHRGLQPMGGADLSAPSQASLVAPAPTGTEPGAPWAWLVMGGVGVVLLALAGVGVGVWVATETGPDGGAVVLDLDALDGLGEPLTGPLGGDGGDAADPVDGPTAEGSPGERPPPGSRPPASSRPAPATTGLPAERPPPMGSVGGPSARPAAEQADRGGPDDPEAGPGDSRGPGEADAGRTPEEPVVVTVDRRTPAVEIVEVEAVPPEDRGDEAPEAAPGSAEAADPPAPEPAGVGLLTVSAVPYGIDYDVFIDGQLVEKGARAPVVKHELPAGEHFVTISVAGGARKQFEITVADGQHVRRSWDFERNQWRR